MSITKLRCMELKDTRYSVYPYDGYNLEEILGKFYEVIKECNDLSFSLQEFNNWLISEGLADEVLKQLNKVDWDNVVNSELYQEVLNELNLTNGMLEIKANKVDLDKTIQELNNVKEELEDITQSRFGKKKYVAIGDSITVGFVDRPYPMIVGEDMNMTVVNMGVSGSAITVTNDRNDSVFERRGDIPEDANIISIFAGTNDYGHNSIMGMSNSTSFNEFYGAFKMLIEWIQENRPNATLFVITPLHRENDKIENSLGYVLEDYVNVIKDICNTTSVPCLDLFKCGGLNPNIQKHKELFAPDGLHPLQPIHNIIGHYKIPQFIRGL